MDLSRYTTPEIKVFREELNLTDDETVVFDMLAKSKSRTQIAFKLNCSLRTIDNRICSIRAKLHKLGVDV